MKQRFGLDLAHVPYRNSPQSIADVAAGHVALGLRRSRRLAAADPGRQAARARGDVGDAAADAARRCRRSREAVGAPDFEAVSWHVLLAPAGTPPDVVDRLHAEMKRIMAAPEIKQKIADIGLIPLDIASVEDTARATSRPKARSGARWFASSGWRARNER